MKSWLPGWMRKNNEPQMPPLVQDSFIELPFACQHSSGVAVPNRQKILRQLHETCLRQLKMLCQALPLNSAVILWSGPQDDQFSLYASSSCFAVLQAGPYRSGVGVTGALKEQDRFALAPLSASSPQIPYYRSHESVGSFMAVKMRVSASPGWQQDGVGMLCVDRESSASWNEAEQQLIADAAEQLTAVVAMARQLFSYDRERHAYRRAFDGLRKLNAALGLESTFAATADAVKTIVTADFISLCLVEGGRLHICYAQGDNAEQLVNQSFPLEQGLVGQVIKYRRTLPDNADYLGTSPVFSEAHLFAEYRSLLIIPLAQENGEVVGAMTVAAERAETFTLTCREMLELVATQVAIKIQLAKSHEQLSRLATIDELTGIANRRAYQRGFEAMIDRARRRDGCLHLILCDIDHFKRINDNFGHPFGDLVLQQIAKLFDRVVRANDLAARTGGEEFAILLEETDCAGARKVAERLRELVEGLQLKFGTTAVPVTISLGIAEFPLDADSLEALASCSDQALYQAKAAGRNQTKVWRQTSPD